MPRRKIRQVVSKTRRTGDDSIRRLVFGTVGLAALLAVSAVIGRWDGLAASVLLYLLGFAAVLRLMLAQPTRCDDCSTKSNDPTNLIWLGRKAPRA